MTALWFLTHHDAPELVQEWLAALGVRDPERGRRDLADLARRAGPAGLELVGRLAEQLDLILPKCADAGMALANLERFVAAASRIEAVLVHLGANPRATEILLQVFSTSQYLSEALIRDPGLFDWLESGPERPDRADLIAALESMLADNAHDEQAKLALRRFRQRQTLRIGYNDIVRGFPLEMITQDLSDLADACVETAVRLAWASARPGLATR